MIEELKFDNECRKSILSGVEKLTKAVSKTLGPKGRNVMLNRDYESPLITNDGVSIAKEIQLRDYYENMGAQILKEAAIKTNEIAGDGTTSSTVLAYSLIKDGMNLIMEQNVNPVLLRKGINIAVDMAIKEIENLAKPLDGYKDVERIATISAGDNETGMFIAKAIEHVGIDGVITIEESSKATTELIKLDGMEIDRGFISPAMTNNKERTEANIYNPLVLVTTDTISNISEILGVLEYIQSKQKSLLLFVEDIDQETLATVIQNNLNGYIDVYIVKNPGFGEDKKEILLDICAITGSTLISRDNGLRITDFSEELLGSLASAKIKKDKTIMVSHGKTDKIKERIMQIKAVMDEIESPFEKQRFEERITKLNGGAAVIKIGAHTEIEMKEKKLRLEDAVNATKAAGQEGIVAGGGSTYIQVEKNMDFSRMFVENDVLLGMELVKKALLAPITQIAENGGLDPKRIINYIKKNEDNIENIGFDAFKERYCDMIETGIIDPAKVSKAALLNAASVASTLITTEAAVVGIKDEKSNNGFM